MAAFVCSKCGHTNPHGSLYCEDCFGLLLDTLPAPPDGAGTDALSDGLAPLHDVRRTDRFTHASRLNPHAVALYIGNETEPLIVVVVRQVILGRVVLRDVNVRVDLSPFGAVDKGVSRQHAVLNRVHGRLMVEDMGSSNGTRLNDELLQPFRPAPITSGARLRLGQLELEIYLPG